MSDSDDSFASSIKGYLEQMYFTKPDKPVMLGTSQQLPDEQELTIPVDFPYNRSGPSVDFL